MELTAEITALKSTGCGVVWILRRRLKKQNNAHNIRSGVVECRIADLRQSVSTCICNLSLILILITIKEMFM